MPPATTKPTAAASARLTGESLVHLVQCHFEALREVRRGVCLLNAGQYEKAAEAFTRAERLGFTERSLPAYLAACHLGQGRLDAAVERLSSEADTKPELTDLQIRRALALSASGRREEAIASLRDAIVANPECAELHFQLGTLLTTANEHEEAELRFTQAANIDRNHTEALVSLGLCCGVRGAPGEAVKHLQRAQTRKPHDARVGLLLAQAAKATSRRGHAVGVRAAMPEEELDADRQGIEELSRLIETDPDYVDAFLSIPAGKVDDRFFAMLLETLRAALERQPEHAELHFHCGRVLERLGRHDDAIDENERAVRIDPKFTRALIALGKLYQKTDRAADATTRLERAVAAGADYADVYYLLGNLYREQGEVMRARGAYRRALFVNSSYSAAQKALATLPA